MVKPSKKVEKKNKLVEKKLEAIKNAWSFVEVEAKDYEFRMNSICQSTCAALRKIYADKLKKIPEDVRNMTVAEFLEMEKRNKALEKAQDEEVKFLIEKTKLLTEKKKTGLKKLKRSCSVSELRSSKGGPKSSLLSVPSRVLSESNLCTPITKRSVAPVFSITPKFNPKLPLNTAYFRKPKEGEMVVSLSGSPLQNSTDDMFQKRCVSLPLGQGKVVKIITENTDKEISKLESDFVRQLDTETKSTLENLKLKLGQLL